MGSNPSGSTKAFSTREGLLILWVLGLWTYHYLYAMRKIIYFTRLVFSNFYLGTSFLFLIWISFFDGNDLISLFGNQIKLKETEAEIQFFRKKIDMVIAEQNSLKGSSAAMEKFARERFLMKKDNEDVFVIKEDSDNSMFDWISKN